MAVRFNPPPGWPPAPEGWTPPPGWAPDPSWPTPPPGWQLWVDDAVPAPGAPASPVPPAGAPDVSRFAGPDAATQVFATHDAPSLDKQAPDGASAPFGAPAPPSAPAPGGFGGAPQGAAPSGFEAQPGGWQGGPAAAGAPTGGKQWLIPVIIAVVALLAIFGVLIATGVIGGDDSKASSQSESAKPTPKKTAKPTPSDDPTEEASDEPSEDGDDVSGTPAAGNNGTRSAPLAAGEFATFSTWSVTMGATNTDAWAEISTVEHESYAPKPGTVYVMSPATVTYTGDDRGSVGDLEWVYVSAAGTTYDDECGYANLPNQLDRYQELYTDATTTGNLCVTVPADQVAGGVWRTQMWLDDEEAYFALS